METVNLVILLIILLNGYVTYKGLQSRTFFERYLFKTDPILVGKDYGRLISSGFLHVHWWHFAFNMFAFYLFGKNVLFILENQLGMLGTGIFLLLYLLSLVGGNLLALYIHRHHGDYRAVGASGAVSGVMMFSIILFPDIRVWFIPGWLFALGFMLFSIYGIKSQKDMIGHEAHLGGAIVGILLPLVVMPAVFFSRLWLVLLLLVPVCVFLYLLVTRPHILWIPNFFRYELSKVKEEIKTSRKAPPGRSRPGLSPQAELDMLLDKVQEVGYQQLSKQEKKRLEELSKKLGE